MSFAARLASSTTALLTAASIAGCGALSDSGSGSDHQITAAFYPLAYAAERVAGDRYDVVNLTQPGQEPHDLSPTVKETTEISKAALVVVEHGFQPSVDAVVDGNAEGEVLDVTDVIELQRLDGDPDPHFWQDPLLLADVGDATADRLADIDPDHADEYHSNAAKLRSDLEDLDREYADGLAHCAIDTVVVNHDAFGYLGKYGLHIEPIVGLSPDAEPTPADLGRLQSLIRRSDITTVFSETLVSPKTADTLAHDLGIDAEVLDPIEGLTDETADEDYLSLMRRNLRTLQEANRCSA